MFIPCLYSKSNANINNSNSEPGGTEFSMDALHVNVSTLVQMKQTGLYGIIYSSIDFDPYPLYAMIL